jgi:hypothetical protein
MDQTHLLKLFYQQFTSTQAVTRAQVENELAELAADQALSMDQLSDLAFPDVSITGSIIERGSLRFRLRLQPDLTVRSDLVGTAIKNSPASTELAETDSELAVLEMTKTVLPILLERAMIDGRRWSQEQFEHLFLKHHINSHLAQWLVWGAFDRDTLLKTFHVTSDLTLADVNYRGFTLPEGAQIGVVHPLYLSEDERESWRRLLFDYEIIQPFPQILRAIYGLESTSEPQVINSGLELPYQDRMGWVYCRRGLKQGYRYYFARQRTTAYLLMANDSVALGEVTYAFEGTRLLKPTEVDPLVISETIYTRKNMTSIFPPLQQGGLTNYVP